MMEPLVDRLLLDAESRAARREPREALLLLRWAATIASRATMPRVLLAFHRVRALHAMSDQHASVPAAPPPVESDRLGFPVPRFASRPPELDRTAFIPAPRFAPALRSAERGAAPAISPWARGGRRTPMMCLLGVAAVGAVLLGVLPAEGGRAATEAAEAALRYGKPREAVAIVDRLASPDSRALMVRGRAFLALADTPAAVLSLKEALRHRGATAEDVFHGARELARLPCCAAEAADAYLLALERGITSDRLSEIAQHLERAGRTAQARRMRDLGEP